MIGGGAVVSNDGLLVFPIFSEVQEQRFAMCLDFEPESRAARRNLTGRSERKGIENNGSRSRAASLLSVDIASYF